MAYSIAGELTATGHRLVQRVYYEDTDFSGVVYHARYLHFLERGRTDYLRLLGVEQRALHGGGAEEGVAFVVHRMEIDFRAAARMDDVVAVDTETEKAGGAKLVLAQTVSRDGRPLVCARVVVAVVDARGRPRRLPGGLAAKFSNSSA